MTAATMHSVLMTMKLLQINVRTIPSARGMAGVNYLGRWRRGSFDLSWW